MEINPNKNSAAGVPQRLRHLLEMLGENLIERDTPLRLAILAALSGEHLLLVGPPGTAKSALARRMRLAFPEKEGAYFERLLTRFTVPEELFGPLSIKGLEEDRYERLTRGYLPSASVAFLDEIFKANSAILNALLTLLNERQFDNGVNRVNVPLIAVVGASNELPEGEELSALFDRFLFRCHVAPVSSDSFPRLLNLPQVEPDPGSEFRFSTDELRQIQQDAEMEVSLPDNVRRLLGELRAWCQAENIAVSDRRWRKIVGMLKVSAFSNGRKEVSIWDAWLAQHCVWEKPEQREKVHGWYEERVGVGRETDNRGLVSVIKGLERKLEKDKVGVAQVSDEKGRLLYISKATRKSTTRSQEYLKRDGKFLYLAPDDHVHFQDHHGRMVEGNKDNNGKGYTRDEIMSMGPERGYKYSGEYFDEHLNDKRNRMVVKNDPQMGPAPQKPVYVQQMTKQADDALGAVRQHREFLSEQKRTLEDEIHGHLWVPDDFAGPAAVALDGAMADADKLIERVGQLREGFASLPLEKEITAEEVAEETEEENDRPGEQTDPRD